MFRLARFDVVDQTRPAPALIVQILFAMFVSLCAVGLRMAIDQFFPHAGPFGLTMPFVLIATLFGRWRAGVVTQILLSLHAWYFVLPMENSFSFETPEDGPRVLVNMVAGFSIVWLGEIFRSAMRRAMQDREALLLELEHRVKNSFASVSGLIRMQLREVDDPETAETLQGALMRIDSYARAFTHLSQRFDDMGELDMSRYLPELCNMLQSTLEQDRAIEIACEAISLKISRDRAIAIGLIVSEFVANSAKYAFDENGGRISLDLTKKWGKYKLAIADNGKGYSDTEAPRKGSFGMKLIESLAAQAQAELEKSTSPEGTRLELSLKA